MDAAALNPAALVRAGFQRWLQARLKRSDSLLLTQRNIYIVPTRAGLLFGLTLLVLLLASINYQLNLGYVLTFLLAGSGVVSMVLTHATLRGLTLHLKPAGAGLCRRRRGARRRADLPRQRALRHRPEARRGGRFDRRLDRCAGRRPGGRELGFVPRLRGLHEVPALSAATRFPLGLFRAWTAWRPAARLLVYPQPERAAPALPAVRPVRSEPARSRSADGSESEGVRAYRRGDPLNRVAWKKAATALETGGELVSRDTAAASHAELWLDWAACGALAAEQRLSRLTAWTLAAQRVGADYGLRLPGVTIAPASGEPQRRRCLEALALWR